MLIALLATIILAIYSSSDDFKEIVADKKIRHGAQWLFRAAVVTLVCYLLKCILFAIPLAFLFSALFRYKLNKKRGLDWRYIGPWSSIYDKLWFLFETRNINFKEDVPLLIKHGPTIYNSKEYVFVQKFENRRSLAVLVHEYRRWIHRAGTVAYIFEAVVFVCGSILYLLYA